MCRRREIRKIKSRGGGNENWERGKRKEGMVNGGEVGEVRGKDGGEGGEEQEGKGGESSCKNKKGRMLRRERRVK